MKKQFIAFVNRRYVTAFGMPTCGSETLPVVDFDFCEPEVKASEIQRIFLCKVGGASFTDWTDPVEWTSRVSETATTINAIRALTVIGDKPAPANTVKDVSNGRKVISRKDHTLNFTIDEVTDDNHTFLQGVQNGKRFRMWYETAGGHMFGGNDGIFIELTGDMVLARGAGEIAVYNYVATWTNPATETRIDSPIFGQTVAGSTVFDTTILFASDATPENGDCDFILAGGTNAVANFQYNDINPTIGAAIEMLVKISGTTVLTANMTADFVGAPFSYKHTTGTVYTGIILDGNADF